MKVIQHRSIILSNIKCPQLSKPKARQQWQGTKTPSGDWMEKKKILGKSRLRLKGNVYNTWECGQVLPFKMF